MAATTLKKTIIVLLHALVIWILCGMTMGIGRALVGIETTLVVHLIGAPVFAALVSLFYYCKYNYTSPLQTAFIFMFFAIILDAGLVAPVFEKSYVMFESAIGTWIPFGLIFISTLVTGLIARDRNT
jgi:hypothetical protein